MFSSVKNYVWERRNGAMKVAGVVGGCYLVRGYVLERLDEVKGKLEEERVAKDGLKRRFTQTHEDVAFTVMQLVQTLAEQIVEEMDVEGLTRELQSRSSTRRRTRVEAEGVGQGQTAQREHEPEQQRAPAPPPPAHRRQDSTSSDRSPSSRAPSSLGYDVRSVSENDGHSEAGASASDMSLSPDSFSAYPALEGGGGGAIERQLAMPAAADLSTSMLSTLTDGSSLSETPSTGTEASLITSNGSSSASATRSKAELWNEVKMLTLTRTLTTLYSTTLLSLLTTLQLTLLARAKYVHSVLQAEKEQSMQERLEAQLSITNLLVSGWGGGGGEGGGLERLLERLESGQGLLEEGDGGDEYEDGEWDIPEEVESRFLTMAWWILHVGWKDVRERVRRGVEEVFDGVSLKMKLAPIDLHRLVSDVRRRVEHEVTFEGTERRTNFLSSLLPPTPETVQHVLTQNGFPSVSASMAYPELEGTEFGIGGGGGGGFEPDDLSAFSFLSLSVPALPQPLSPGSAPYQDRRLSIQPSGGSSATSGMGMGMGTGTMTTSKDPYTQDPRFTSLLEELRGIIASNDFMHVLGPCLDRATEVLFQDLERDVFVESGGGGGGGGGGEGQWEGEGSARIWEVEEVRIRLAGLLPGLSRWSQVVLEGVPNVLVDNLLDVGEVRCLSALVFGRFEEKFGR